MGATKSQTPHFGDVKEYIVQEQRKNTFFFKPPRFGLDPRFQTMRPVT